MSGLNYFFIRIHGYKLTILKAGFIRITDFEPTMFLGLSTLLALVYSFGFRVLSVVSLAC